MKINAKKIVLGIVSVVSVFTLVFTSVMASKEVNLERKEPKRPGAFQMHKERPEGFPGKGGWGFFKGERKELTEEEKTALKEKFGERKELTEEEKTALKEKMETKKAEMNAKFQEKEAERQAKLKEKLDKGEITQEQYDKMMEKKPGREFKGNGRGRARGVGHGFRKGPRGKNNTEVIE